MSVDILIWHMTHFNGYLKFNIFVYEYSLVFRERLFHIIEVVAFCLKTFLLDIVKLSFSNILAINLKKAITFKILPFNRRCYIF